MLMPPASSRAPAAGSPTASIWYPSPRDEVLKAYPALLPANFFAGRKGCPARPLGGSIQGSSTCSGSSHSLSWHSDQPHWPSGSSRSCAGPGSAASPTRQPSNMTKASNQRQQMWVDSRVGNLRVDPRVGKSRLSGNAARLGRLQRGSRKLGLAPGWSAAPPTREEQAGTPTKPSSEAPSSKL